MTIVYSRRFLRSLEAAPPAVRKAFFKQLGYLERNLLHPSLRAKKYGEAGDLWQGRVNRDWRFYFTIESNEYRLHEIKPHPK
jgi:mRNA-degrading endonuclease RelE of RelBE toxin-antitoxin system